MSNQLFMGIGSFALLLMAIGLAVIRGREIASDLRFKKDSLQVAIKRLTSELEQERLIVERLSSELSREREDKTSLIVRHLGPAQEMNVMLVDALRRIADNGTGFGQRYAAETLKTHGYR